MTQDRIRFFPLWDRRWAGSLHSATSLCGASICGCGRSRAHILILHAIAIIPANRSASMYTSFRRTDPRDRRSPTVFREKGLVDSFHWPDRHAPVYYLETRRCESSIPIAAPARIRWSIDRIVNGWTWIDTATSDPPVFLTFVHRHLALSNKYVIRAGRAPKAELMRACNTQLWLC